MFTLLLPYYEIMIRNALYRHEIGCFALISLLQVELGLGYDKQDCSLSEPEQLS